MSSTEEFLRKNIYKELKSQGFSHSLSLSCANKGVDHFKSTSIFPSGAYLECCNHAGLFADQMSIGIKFKQVKAKRQKRTKRPQDAWDF